MKKKKIVIQTHHISYDPEITVKVLRSEHFHITTLNRFGSLTPGAKRAIRHILRVKPTRKLG